MAKDCKCSKAIAEMLKSYGKKTIHRFNGQKPFDWQKCQCKRFTFQELNDINTQNLIEAKGEAVT